MMPSFGERYRAWRDSKGVSNYLVWKRTGIAESALSNMEKGNYNPSDEVLAQIASVPELELTLDDLKAWKAIDRYGEAALRRAIEYLESQEPS